MSLPATFLKSTVTSLALAVGISSPGLAQDDAQQTEPVPEDLLPGPPGGETLPELAPPGTPVPDAPPPEIAPPGTPGPDPVPQPPAGEGADAATGAEAGSVSSLLDRLAEAPSPQDQRIVNQIFTEWSKSGSPTVDLLLMRGETAMEEGDPDTAIGHFTAAIDWDPEFAEAYHGRATAYYQAGLIGPAIDDLRQTLILNPRHFRAMQGFAVLLEEMDRPEDALELYRRVHAMHPADGAVATAMERLEIQLGGSTL